MTLDDIEEVIGKTLPTAYKTLLGTIDDFEDIDGLDDYSDPTSRTSWFFWGIERLDRIVRIDGAPDRPAWGLLASFVEIDKRYRHRTQAPSDAGPIDYERLNKSVAIATDEGDYLYFDVIDNFSLWAYWHDSGEVKKVSDSFDEWAASMVRDT